jgi:hypothetical protein
MSTATAVTLADAAREPPGRYDWTIKLPPPKRGDDGR